MQLARMILNKIIGNSIHDGRQPDAVPQEAHDCRLRCQHVTKQTVRFYWLSNTSAQFNVQYALRNPDR